MHLIKSSQFLVFLIVLFGSISTTTAQIWPGDIDNNGIAENVDLLYMGYAYGEIGSPRSSTSIVWTPHPAGPLWGVIFPNLNLDISYADCNGDGVVDDLDIEAIEQNYSLTHPTITSAPMLAGIPGIDPTVEIIRNSTDTLQQGKVEFFELHLGPGHYSDFYGISFTISFDTAYVDSVVQVFPASGWITNNNTDKVIMMSHDYIEPNSANGRDGRIDIAYSRTNGVPIMGSGFMGIFAIVIEDNLNGKLDGAIDFDMEVLNIRYVDEQLDFKPTVSSISEFYILSTDVSNPIIEDNSLNVYPNPAVDFIMAESTTNEITGYELYNLQGQLIQQDFFESNTIVELRFEEALNGIHLLKLHTPRGLLIKKIMIVNY